MDRKPPSFSSPRPLDTRRKALRDPRVLAIVGLMAVLIGIGVAAAFDGRPSALKPSGQTPAGSAAPPPGEPSAATSHAAESVSPSAAPPASAAARASASPRSSTDPSTLFRPVRASAGDIGGQIQLAAGPDGGVFVAIPDGANVRLVLLDADGTPRSGWPIRIPSNACWSLLPAEDGSVRLLCDAVSEGDGLGAPTTRIFAFDSRGRALSGWPVDSDGGAGRVIGTDLLLLVVPYTGDTPDETTIETVVLDVVSETGKLQTGADVPLFDCCENSLAIGPDGTGYVVGRRETDDGPVTDIRAFDANGTRLGWPITLDGDASDLAFDDDGLVHAFVMSSASEKQVIVLAADGTVVAGPWASPIYSTGPFDDLYGGRPGSPIVASDGTSFIVSSEDATTVVALGADNRPLDGWPWHSELWMQPIACSGDAHCGDARARPVVGPDDTLFVGLEASGTASGGQIVAVDVTGQVAPGWPVNLKRAGSMIWAIAPAVDGIWALAIEPEGNEFSATVLSIASDSDVRWATTVVEP